jgi:polyvinyl alcohol dehydrogenase (cytochrome)
MRIVVAAIVSILFLPAVAAAQPAAPNGEAVYTQHCAACHEGSLPRMPSREALRMLTPEHIDTALSSFSMRRQGAALSPAERRAVSAFLSGRPAGSYRAPLDAIARSAYCSAGAAAPRDLLTGLAWNGWGGDLRNSRHQPAAAAGLAAGDIPRLKLKWAFGFPGVSASGSQVTIVGSRVYVGSRNGMVYALDARTGCIAWAFQADAGVRSTPVVGRTAAGGAGIYFGDAHAQVYALDAASGALRWKVTVETHLDAIITGGITFHEGRLYVPVSSLEEGTAVIPTYECCTFRGSVTALNGRVRRAEDRYLLGGFQSSKEE